MAALAEAIDAVNQAKARRAEAEGALAAAEGATREAAEEVIAASDALDEAKGEQRRWEEENPLEAAGKVGAEVGAAVVDTAANALLTSLFGESKSAKAARLEREAKEASARAEAAARAAAQRAQEAAQEEAARARDDAVAEAAAAEAAATEAAASAEAEARAAREAEELAARDAELRRRREEAEAILRQRRPTKLSESIATGAMDAAFAAAAAAAEGDGASDAGKGVGAWAAQQRAKLREQTLAREKRSRMALFEADLGTLGLSLEEAVGLDERSLRRAFRERSRVLHPDVRAQQAAETLEGVPSVYELNAAYEAVRKLL